MKRYDISVAIEPNIPVWEGDPAVNLQKAMSIERGDPANVTRLDIGAHTATHVDAPVHFIAGRKSVDQLDLNVLIGLATVVEFDQEQEITAADLEAAVLSPKITRLLLKTRNSRLWRAHPAGFSRDFVGLSLDGALWVVEHHIQLLGVDYLGIERYDSVMEGAKVHHCLLESDIIILEGLDLSQVPAGDYQLVCLPLKIAGSDGAPARAVLTALEDQQDPCSSRDYGP